MAMKNYEVTYTVQFTTVIQVPDGGIPEDEAADIDIPEGPGGEYIPDSFNVDSIVPTDKPATNAFDPNPDY